VLSAFLTSCGGGSDVASSSAGVVAASSSPSAVSLAASYAYQSPPVSSTYSGYTANLVASYPWVLGTADFNGDGNTDILIQVQDSQFTAPKMTPIILMAGNGKGGFSHDPSFFVGGETSVYHAIASLGDFNNDGYLDMLLMDAGPDSENSLTFQGQQTYMFMGTASHQMTVKPLAGISYYAKNTFVVDINKDGNLDIFVESGGESGNWNQTGTNYPSHFLMGNGNGTFTVDLSRIEGSLLDYNSASWGKSATKIRHLGEVLADFNNDGYPDLFLPQNAQPYGFAPS